MKSGTWKAESGTERPATSAGEIARASLRSRSVPNSHFHFRFSPVARGVTLIELLITMVIIAILSAAILGTASAAMESARKKRTQSLVTKIHTLLMEHYATYETRRADISSTILNQVETAFRNGQISAKDRGEMLGDIRLLATRELMKYEMPDRWSDFLNQPLNDSNPRNTPLNAPTVLERVPSLSQRYYRRLTSLSPDADAEEIRGNQGAECLYMTIMFATGDGEARTLFSKQDIGDTDGDGAPEFIDGWGNPIQFVRWPAGFVGQSELMSGNGETDHDPFDVYRRDSKATVTPDPARYPPAVRNAITEMRQRNSRATLVTPTAPPVAPYLNAFRLMPLVFSIGPDGDSDIVVVKDGTTLLNPYSDSINVDGLQIGLAYDEEENGEGWKDNIHNHLIEY